MPYKYSVYTVTMASAGTLTGEANLGGTYKVAYLEVLSMNSNSQHHIKAANESGGTYRQVYHPSLNSSTVGTNVFAIGSAVSNGFIPIPDGLQFIKVETTATVDNGTTYRIHAGD
jgi:hypothetical protein